MIRDDEEAGDLPAKLASLRVLPVPKVMYDVDDDCFEIRFGEGSCARLRGPHKVLLVKDDGTEEACAGLGMISDWLYRLAHEEEQGGFQEFSAEYLADQFDEYAEQLEAVTVSLIVSVLLSAWHNPVLRPQTHANVAKALVTYARRFPAYADGVIARLTADVV